MRWWHNASDQFSVISHQMALVRNGEGFLIRLLFDYDSTNWLLPQETISYIVETNPSQGIRLCHSHAKQ